VPNEKTDAWMPLWIGAYLADTLTFTTLQHGAYMLLLMAYWRERSALPDDDESLRSIAKMGRAEWARVRPVLAKKFRVADGVWWHKRVEAEMQAADARSQKAKQKAQDAANKRWKTSHGDAPSNAPSIPTSNAPAMLEECPTPSPSENNTSEAKASGAAGAGKVTDPDEIIFGYGVPILVNAGTLEKHARSFLGKLRKEHGDVAVIDTLRRCLKAKPVQPLEWLAAAMPPKAIANGDAVAAKATDETRKYLDEQRLTPEQKALADKAAAAALSAIRGVTKRSAA
jgi:uncharacterized protein YdaU (DUF1376 family)